MKILNIESAFNRIPNGNFSHGLAHWVAPSAIHVVNGTENGAPTEEGVPRYYLVNSAGQFWAEIPYKDLSVYPSRVNFVRLPPFAPTNKPLDYRGRYLIYSPTRDVFVRPFRSYVAPLNQDGPTVVVGDPIFLSDVDFNLYSGEYRVERIMRTTVAQYEAVVLPTRFKSVPPIATFAEFGRFQYKRENGWTDTFRLRFDPSIDNVDRPDGNTDILRNVDYFISERYTGQITGTPAEMIPSVPGEYMVKAPQGAVPPVEIPYKIPPTTAGAWVELQDDWFITPSFECVMMREMPVALYDLTLAFSTHSSHEILPGSVLLKFYDEMGQPIYSKAISWIDPPDPPAFPWPTSAYFRMIDLGLGWRRYICHFLFEASYPMRGTARMAFNSVGWIGDVVLLKGDYIQEMSEAGPSPSGPVLDILEHPVDQQSEIIPQGTIIAYVGGAVCPPGYIRAEGVGEEAGLSTLEGERNRIDVGTFQYVFRNTIGPPNDFVPLIGKRTRGRITETHDPNREPRTYFHVPPNSPLILTSGFRPDVVPGCVVEIRIAHDGVGIHPRIDNPDEAVILQNKGQTTPSHYSIFGVISYCGILYVHDVAVPSSPPIYEIEIIGDFEDALNEIKNGTMNGDVFIWRSGPIAHKQRVNPETSNPADDWSNSGGYGTADGVHRHLVEKAVMGEHTDIGQQGSIQSIRIPYNHDTRPTFKASFVPKIRPVLLCQKL